MITVVVPVYRQIFLIKTRSSSYTRRNGWKRIRELLRKFYYKDSARTSKSKIIRGIPQPTSGSVEVNGRVSTFLEQGAGYHLEFTGRRNICVNGSIPGLAHQEIGTHFDEIAAFADIEELLIKV